MVVVTTSIFLIKINLKNQIHRLIIKMGHLQISPCTVVNEIKTDLQHRRVKSGVHCDG
jgi:hypothetical protein